MAQDWSHKEVDLILTDYFSMLIDELSGKPINKASHRKFLIPLLNNRSEGSVEFKHQNISAALVKAGLPYIKGYKPRYNYQQLLDEKVINYIKNHLPLLKPKFIDFAKSKTLTDSSLNVNFKDIIQDPPEKQIISESKISYKRKIPFKVNYLEREQNNSLLGKMGEKLVIEYEKWRLIGSGQEKLAEKIEWVSQYDDGAGFDILSMNLDGSEKYIEVKTTKLTKETPIFFSKNEYEFSVAEKQNYNLYRVFNFDEVPKIFTLKGSLDEICRIEPIQFKGHF